MLRTEDTILFIIDIQEKLLNAAFNKDNLLKKANVISNIASLLNIPTIITEQYPKGLGNTVEDLAKTCSSAIYYEKTDFNALCIDNLKQYLNSLNRKKVLISGIETHICVYQTAMALLTDGYEVTILIDACGSRSETEHNRALDYLMKTGADIKTTEMVVFELLKTSKHPQFKQIQALIK